MPYINDFDREWVLVVRLLGAAFVGYMKTGQQLLNIIKPAFIPSQNPQVKAKGFQAWVALAESLSRSGSCVHKTSRCDLQV